MRITIDAILVEGRLRKVDADSVQAIAASIDESGQHQPVAVRRTNAAKKPYTLIDGAHRLAALRLLGRVEVEAEIRKLNKDAARLAEIDTNLIRADLTALDRAIFLAERKKLYEKLHPETTAGGDRKSALFKNQNDKNVALKFTDDVAERLNLSARSIERAVFIAEYLQKPTVAALRGTVEAKHASRLLKLARLAPDKQQVAVNLFRENVPLADAIIQADGGKKKKSDTDRTFEQLINAWEKAPTAARCQFLEAVRAEIDLLREGNR